MAERRPSRAWPERPARPTGRRPDLGQHALADARVVARFLDTIEITPGELVVDLGAGTGGLTLPLLDRGARVVAVEVDPVPARHLRRIAAALPTATQAQLRILEVSFDRFRLPTEPYRVIANPPFGRSTDVLRLLLDDPGGGPWRADLVLQLEVVRKRAALPPTSLLSAAWAPWWSFTHGMGIARRAFGPPPSVDAAVLHIVRRDPPLLPVRLAPGFADTLRPRWGGSASPARGRGW